MGCSSHVACSLLGCLARVRFVCFWFFVFGFLGGFGLGLWGLGVFGVFGGFGGLLGVLGVLGVLGFWGFGGFDGFGVLGVLVVLGFLGFWGLNCLAFQVLCQPVLSLLFCLVACCPCRLTQIIWTTEGPTKTKDDQEKTNGRKSPSLGPACLPACLPAFLPAASLSCFPFMENEKGLSSCFFLLSSSFGILANDGCDYCSYYDKIFLQLL